VNRNKGDKKIRDKNIGGIGGLGVGLEVKDGTGLNTRSGTWIPHSSGYGSNPLRAQHESCCIIIG